VKNYDLIFINDLRYLPLSKYAHQLNKTVIYDTIDHNVFLRFYQLEQKIKLVRPFKFPITSLFKSLEKKYAKKYCDEVLVNSDSLYQYFDQKATTLFYSSPFESLSMKNDSTKPSALLYLGIFSREKGAVEIIELQKRTNAQLFIFGDVSEAGLLDAIKNNSSITYTPKVSIETLTIKLQELLNKFYLLGFSLIQPAHYSYEVQEANKDIDYLALGIPLIGNQRLPTKEKIEAGCGIYFNDSELGKKMNDPSIRKSMSENCIQYYKSRYASNHFNSKLDAVLSKYLPS
jgi:glycosyltransferase involved in cell wall biosynthesis